MRAHSGEANADYSCEVPLRAAPDRDDKGAERLGLPWSAVRLLNPKAARSASIRAATQTDGVNASLLTRPDEKVPFKEVLKTNFRESVSPQFYTFDNKNLDVTSNIGRDKAAVVTIDPGNGKELEKIYENPEVDVDALAYSKKRKVMTLAAFDTWKTERKFFDAQTEAMYKRSRKNCRATKSRCRRTIRRERSLLSWRATIARPVRAICST